MDQDATWYGVDLDPSEIVVRQGVGTQLPFPKRGQSPQFSAHVYCGQTAAWIKMLLGTEAGLGPGHIVLGKEKGKEEYLYSAFLHQGTHKALRHGSHSFTCKQHPASPP